MIFILLDGNIHGMAASGVLWIGDTISLLSVIDCSPGIDSGWSFKKLFHPNYPWMSQQSILTGLITSLLQSTCSIKSEYACLNDLGCTSVKAFCGEGILGQPHSFLNKASLKNEYVINSLNGQNQTETLCRVVPSYCFRARLSDISHDKPIRVM